MVREPFENGKTLFSYKEYRTVEKPNVRVGTGSLVTIIVGHFVAQIVTDHPPA